MQAQSNLTRTRDNQRRSRARRREYVSSLEARLKEYEQRGVSATITMQRAARAVSQENTRLRALLALHGVKEEEIDAYVNSGIPATAANNSATCGNATAGKRLEPVVAQARQIAAQPSIASSHAHSTNAVTESITASGQPPPTSPSHTIPFHHQVQTTTETACYPKHCLPESNRGNLLPAPCCHPSIPSLSTVPTNNAVPISEAETSCDIAANILAQLRGDGDQASARAALCYPDKKDCTVKNTTLFQLMDET